MDKVIFTTTRLEVRPITAQDQIELLKILQDPLVMEKAWKKTYSLEETRQWLEKINQQYRQFGYSYFFIVEKTQQTIVGLIGALPTQLLGKPEIELAYLIKPAFQRQGFALEAASGMLHFLHLAGVKEVVAQLVPENQGSKRIVEKLGLHYQQTYLRDLNGSPTLHLIYRKSW